MTRGVFGPMWQNFIKSLRRPPPDLPVGKDHLGNKYFESKKDEASGRRYKRWFVPYNEDKFDQEVPVEWEAWLRYRRKVPPTDEEVLHNESVKKGIQEKVKALEEQRRLDKGTSSPLLESTRGETESSFPERVGYHKVPGGGYIREAEERPKVDEMKENK